MAKDKDKDKKKGNGPEPEFDPSAGSGPASDEPVIRDKRRIDPETGDVREPSPAEPDALDEELAQLLEEGVSDEADAAPQPAAASVPLEELQRLQAEFVNYRKRVERDRSLARELAIADVVTELLPVLDDLELADKHGDLEEGSSLALVVQKLHTILQRVGLEALEPKGEPFDPNVHEAIARVPTDDDDGTVIDVVVTGYRIGERLLRPAKVAVSAPKE